MNEIIDAGSTFLTAEPLPFNTPHTESLGINNDLADCYSLSLTNGIFQVIGNVGSLKVKAQLYDANGKKIGTISVKSGKLSMKPRMLEAGTYYLLIESKDRGKTAGDYTLSVTGTEFPAPTPDNAIGSATSLPLDANGLGSASGWVGLGDAADYYKITPDSAGRVMVGLSGLTSKVKVTLYDAAGKKLKSVTVAKDNGDVFKGTYLLGADAAYLSVESGDGGKGKYNTDYTLNVHDDYFPKATADGDFEHAQTLTLNDSGFGSGSGWVGYGDTVDYYRIDPASAGRVYIGIGNITSKVKVTFYNAAGKRLKSVSVSKDNGDLFKGGYLLNRETAYISVESGDKGKGKYNTDYTLSVSDHYFPPATPNNSLSQAEWVELDGNGQVTIDGWVGFGDAADCYRIDPVNAGSISIDISGLSSNTNVKVSLYSQGKKLRTTTFKKDGSVVTGLQLPAMPVYILVESGDKGKGKYNTNYKLTVTDSYGPPSPTNDSRATATRLEWDQPGKIEVNDWVGNGDKVDFYRFQLDQGGVVDLNLTLEQPGIQLGKQLKLTMYDEAGRKVKLDSALTSGRLDAAVYFISVEVANPKKYETNYRLDIQQLA